MRVNLTINLVWNVMSYFRWWLYQCSSRPNSLFFSLSTAGSSVRSSPTSCRRTGHRWATPGRAPSWSRASRAACPTSASSRTASARQPSAPPSPASRTTWARRSKDWTRCSSTTLQPIVMEEAEAVATASPKAATKRRSRGNRRFTTKKKQQQKKRNERKKKKQENQKRNKWMKWRMWGMTQRERECMCERERLTQTTQMF